MQVDHVEDAKSCSLRPWPRRGFGNHQISSRGRVGGDKYLHRKLRGGPPGTRLAAQAHCDRASPSATSDEGHRMPCASSRTSGAIRGKLCNRSSFMGKLQLEARVRLKNILFLTDFSWASDTAIPFVREIAER